MPYAPCSMPFCLQPQTSTSRRPSFELSASQLPCFSASQPPCFPTSLLPSFLLPLFAPCPMLYASNVLSAFPPGPLPARRVRKAYRPEGRRRPLWLPARLRPVGVDDYAPEGRAYSSERPEAAFPLPNSNPSVIRLLSSVVCRPSSVIRHLSSAKTQSPRTPQNCPLVICHSWWHRQAHRPDRHPGVWQFLWRWRRHRHSRHSGGPWPRR